MCANLLGFAESQLQPSNKPRYSTMAKIKQEEDVVALSSGDEVKCEFLSYISQNKIAHVRVKFKEFMACIAQQINFFKG